MNERKVAIQAMRKIVHRPKHTAFDECLNEQEIEALASTINNGVKAESERDELKAKIKAFLEAWQIDVSGHDGEMMINIKTPASGIDEWGEPRRGTIFGFESTPDDNLPQWSGRGKTLWDLWNAVNQK
jgi:hypothetical protein